MTIVVTGALGHIGSRLIRILPQRFPGNEIVLLDDLSTQRYASLFDLPQEGRYRFIEGDITKLTMDRVVADARVVVHLAAITDATTSFERKVAVELVNFGGTRAVAEACAAASVPLIALSSTSVYGTQKSLVDENCEPEELAPQSPYAESKLREEHLIQELGEARGLRFFLARFGTIFGASPGMRFHTAVNKFCWQAASGQKLTVWRTAYEQKRPYLDLEDAVRAISFVIERRLFDNRVYNVVSLNATVRQIVESIRRYIADLQVEFVDTRIMNQLSYEVLDARFRAAGFQASGDLDRGVRDTLALLAAANGRASTSAAEKAAE